jgi:hypothetical protein
MVNRFIALTILDDNVDIDFLGKVLEFKIFSHRESRVLRVETA